MRTALLCVSNSQGLKDYTDELFSALRTCLWKNDSIDLIVNSEFQKTTPSTNDIYKPISNKKHSPSNAFYLLFFLASKKYDAIHFQGSNLITLILLLVLKKAKRVQTLILTPHSVIGHWNRPFYDRVKKIIWSKYDHIILHTQNDLYLINQMISGPSIHQIPHGTYIKNITPHPNTTIDPNLADVLSNKYMTFLFFGYIRKDKRLDLLIEAWKPLKDYTNLIVAGEYKNSHCTKQEITQNCTIYRDAFIAQDEMAELITRSDIIVLPYDTISESGILHMAYSAGKRVILSNLPSFQERAIPELSYFFEPGNHYSLRSILQHAWDNWKSQNYSEKDSVLTYTEMYSWLKIAEKTQLVYHA